MGVNQAVIMGRITHDLELKTTTSGIAVLSFTIAVDRAYCKQGEERQSDFIDCVAWKERAAFINKHFAKGRMIAVTGELQTRVYEDKNGVKHKATELNVNSVSFTGEKAQDAQAKSQPATDQNATQPAAPDYSNVADDNDYPF